MTRTSTALRRLGVAGLAVVTIGAGVPAFFATSATAAFSATGPALVADDCRVQSTGNTTTTDATTGTGTGCTTQAQINTVRTLSFTYTNNGSPVAGQDIDFTLTETPGPDNNTANFPNTQPAGTTSQPDNMAAAGQLATCTTNAQGKCSVNVTDSEAEDVTVTGQVRGQTGPNSTATETIQFRTNSTAASRLDQVNRVIVQPENSGSNFPNPTVNATPGRPIQLTYAVRDLNGNCTTGTGNNQATCTGAAVANQLITVRVNQSAFFTPNCTPRDQSGTGSPQRSNNNAVSPVGATPGTASTGTLAAPDYRGCSFTTAPTNGAQVGPLVNLGNTITVRTDGAGQFTVTVAEGRDLGFDDDGNVTVALTATEQGSTTALAPSTTGSTTAPAPLLFTTRERALNGGTVDIVFVDGSTAATSTTQNVPNNQTRTFVVQLRDEYGNLTRASGANTGVNSATLTKRGVGTVLRCEDGNGSQFGGSTSTNSCSVPTTAGSFPSTNTVENDGTTTQVYTVFGSFTNRSEQERFRSVPNAFPGSDGGNPTSCFFFGTNCPTPSQVENGTQTVTASWTAPETKFVVDTTTGAAPFGTVTGPNAGPTGVSGGFDQDDTDKILTRVVSFNFYQQQPTNITFTTTPSNNVAPGTVVTVSARVLDQFGNPIQGQPVTFFRTGSSNDCTTTSANQTGNGGASTTGPDGRAGFSFSCAASQQTVTIIVNDQNGNEIRRGTQTVTFGAPAPASSSPAATSTATTTATATSTQTTTSTATATSSTKPCTNTSRVTVNTPFINATGLASVTISGVAPGSRAILEGYSQVHEGTANFANAGRVVRTGIADANGTITFNDIRPSSNTRVRALQEGCTFSNTNPSQSLGAVINVRTTLFIEVTRVAPRTYRFAGDSIPARTGGLIVSIFRITGATCAAGVEPRNCPGEKFIGQARANAITGEYSVTLPRFGPDYPAREQFVLKTGQDAQNAPGRSNVRDLAVF